MLACVTMLFKVSQAQFFVSCLKEVHVCVSEIFLEKTLSHSISNDFFRESCKSLVDECSPFEISFVG